MNIDSLGWVGLATAMEERPDALVLLDSLESCMIGDLHGIGTGGVPITPSDIQCLMDNGVRKLILGFDNDHYTQDVITACYDVAIPPEIFAYDEFQTARPAHEWLANWFIFTYPDHEMLVHKVIGFDESVTNPVRIAHLALHFFPLIEAHIGPLDNPIGQEYQAYRQKVTQKKSHLAIKRAAEEAHMLSFDGKYEAAKEVLFAGYKESESIIKMTQLQPVRTFNECILEHEAHILKYRDRELLGFKTDMEELTNCLMGLRGLILLGSPPNLGKTILATQLALQALRNHPDTCVVYLNLDMDTTDLYTRIRCHVGRFEWAKYTRGHEIPIDAGRKDCQLLGSRLVVLHEHNFTGDEEEILDAINRVKKESGCKRAMVVLDYVQCLEPPQNIRRIIHTDLEVDRWRVSVLKRIRGMVDKHDAVIGISEVRKEAYSRDLTMEDLKGDSRLSYAADVVLLLQSPKEDEWAAHFKVLPGGISTYYPSKRDTKNLDKDLKKELPILVKDRLQLDSIAVGYLQIAKGRDGTVRKRIPITAYFKTATIIEGFYIDGIPAKQVREKGANDPAAIFGDVDGQAM